MAYPESIQTTGPLSVGGDIFEYFLGFITVDLTDDPYDQTQDWLQVWFELPEEYPFSRGTLYSAFDAAFPQTSGQSLYEFEEPQSGWSFDMVKEWGRMKSYELAMFGNVSNGASTSSQTLSYLTGFTKNVTQWRIYSLTYLRFAFRRFEDYGPCYNTIAQQPPPTNKVENTANKTIDWTYAPGFGSPSDYEWAFQDTAWQTVTAKPLQLPTEMEANPGDIQIRTKGDGWFIPSESIYNEEYYSSPRTAYSGFKTGVSPCSYSSSITVYVPTHQVPNIPSIPDDPNIVALPVTVYTSATGPDKVPNDRYRIFTPYTRSYYVNNGYALYYSTCPGPSYSARTFPRFLAEGASGNVCDSTSGITVYEMTSPSGHPDYGKYFRYSTGGQYAPDGRYVDSQLFAGEMANGVLFMGPLKCVE